MRCEKTRRRVRGRVWRLCLASLAVLAIQDAASGQTFSTGFEAPVFSGSAAGTTISGQDSWITPAVTGSIDGKVFTYAGNMLALLPNPTGGDQFLGERSLGGSSFARAQR